MSELTQLDSNTPAEGRTCELNVPERMVQEFLSDNLALLGIPGLTLVQTEYQVPSGRIDILARSAQGHLFAIELKKGVATRDAVGQLQSYLGDLLRAEPLRRAFGVLVASDIDPPAMSALVATPTIEFWSYKTLFTFHRVPIKRTHSLPQECPRCGASNSLGMLPDNGETYCRKCGSLFGLGWK
jgi:RecB family endonuclease NucS